MEEEVKSIRALLDKIVSDDHAEKIKFSRDEFSRFDLPKHVADIVDYLQPLLLPNEAAIYWYLFRNSYVRNMGNSIRFHINDLYKEFEVIGSLSRGAESIGNRGAQVAIEGLETKKVILRRANDNTKDGHFYIINIPSEIQICIDRKKVMDDEKLKI